MCDPGSRTARTRGRGEAICAGCRSHRRHSAVRGGDDQGGYRGGGRGRSAPHCRGRSVSRDGSSPKSARTANGAPRSAGADRRGGADRGGDRLRVFACSAGRGGAQTGRGAQFGARSSLQQVCYFARACLRTRVIYSSTRLCRTPRTHWARSHWERSASRHVLRPRLCRPVRARGGRQAHAANSSKVYLRKSNETSAGKRVASDARRGCHS
jgi:hypothetical protein